MPVGLWVPPACATGAAAGRARGTLRPAGRRAAAVPGCQAGGLTLGVWVPDLRWCVMRRGGVRCGGGGAGAGS